MFMKFHICGSGFKTKCSSGLWTSQKKRGGGTVIVLWPLTLRQITPYFFKVYFNTILPRTPRSLVRLSDQNSVSLVCSL
jgi:hypothetical protein